MPGVLLAPYALSVNQHRLLFPGLWAALLLSLSLAVQAKPHHKAKPPPPPQPLGLRPALVAFADELAAAQNWDASALRTQLSEADSSKAFSNVSRGPVIGLPIVV